MVTPHARRLALCLGCMGALASDGLPWPAARAEPLSSETASLPMEAPTTGRLTFDDEFDTLDLSRYNSRYWWGARWLAGNGERQVYVDPSYTGDQDTPMRLNPFAVENGVLRIEAAVPPMAVAKHLKGQAYTSGLLTTFSSFSQLYGYFEIRAQFPAGKGLWPAFWLVPHVKAPGGEPEIDVVEMLGDDPTTLHMALHWTDPSGQFRSKESTVRVPDMSGSFHRYGLDWTASRIAWYFDGKRVAETETPISHHEPMYLLLNLAVGGHWPGLPSKQTHFPAEMLVDFIRAYAP